MNTSDLKVATHIMNPKASEFKMQGVVGAADRTLGPVESIAGAPGRVENSAESKRYYRANGVVVPPVNTGWGQKKLPSPEKIAKRRPPPVNNRGGRVVRREARLARGSKNFEPVPDVAASELGVSETIVVASAPTKALLEIAPAVPVAESVPSVPVAAPSGVVSAPPSSPVVPLELDVESECAFSVSSGLVRCGFVARNAKSRRAEARAARSSSVDFGSDQTAVHLPFSMSADLLAYSNGLHGGYNCVPSPTCAKRLDPHLEAQRLVSINYMADLASKARPSARLISVGHTVGADDVLFDHVSLPLVTSRDVVFSSTEKPLAPFCRCTYGQCSHLENSVTILSHVLYYTKPAELVAAMLRSSAGDQPPIMFASVYHFAGLVGAFNFGDVAEGSWRHQDNDVVRYTSAGGDCVLYGDVSWLHGTSAIPVGNHHLSWSRVGVLGNTHVYAFTVTSLPPSCVLEPKYDLSDFESGNTARPMQVSDTITIHGHDGLRYISDTTGYRCALPRGLLTHLGVNICGRERTHKTHRDLIGVARKWWTSNGERDKSFPAARAPEAIVVAAYVAFIMDLRVERDILCFVTAVAPALRNYNEQRETAFDPETRLTYSGAGISAIVANEPEATNAVVVKKHYSDWVYKWLAAPLVNGSRSAVRPVQSWFGRQYDGSISFVQSAIMTAHSVVSSATESAHPVMAPYMQRAVDRAVQNPLLAAGVSAVRAACSTLRAAAATPPPDVRGCVPLFGTDSTLDRRDIRDDAVLVIDPHAPQREAARPVYNRWTPAVTERRPNVLGNTQHNAVIGLENRVLAPLTNEPDPETLADFKAWVKRYWRVIVPTSDLSSSIMTDADFIDRFPTATATRLEEARARDEDGLTTQSEIHRTECFIKMERNAKQPAQPDGDATPAKPRIISNTSSSYNMLVGPTIVTIQAYIKEKISRRWPRLVISNDRALLGAWFGELHDKFIYEADFNTFDATQSYELRMIIVDGYREFYGMSQRAYQTMEKRARSKTICNERLGVKAKVDGTMASGDPDTYLSNTLLNLFVQIYAHCRALQIEPQALLEGGFGAAVSGDDSVIGNGFDVEAKEVEHTINRLGMSVTLKKTGRGGDDVGFCSSLFHPVGSLSEQSDAPQYLGLTPGRVALMLGYVKDDDPRPMATLRANALGLYQESRNTPIVRSLVDFVLAYTAERKVEIGADDVFRARRERGGQWVAGGKEFVDVPLWTATESDAALIWASKRYECDARDLVGLDVMLKEFLDAPASSVMKIPLLEVVIARDCA